MVASYTLRNLFISYALKRILYMSHIIWPIWYVHIVSLVWHGLYNSLLGDWLLQATCLTILRLWFSIKSYSVLSRRLECKGTLAKLNWSFNTRFSWEPPRYFTEIFQSVFSYSWMNMRLNIWLEQNLSDVLDISSVWKLVVTWLVQTSINNLS